MLHEISNRNEVAAAIEIRTQSLCQKKETTHVYASHLQQQHQNVPISVWLALAAAASEFVVMHITCNLHSEVMM